MQRFHLAIALLLAFWLPAAAAKGETTANLQAEDDTAHTPWVGTPVMNDRWGLLLGGYLADFKTDAAIGSGSVIGTFLRIEDDLGLNDDASTVRGEGFVRLRPNHALEFGFMRLGRSGTSILDEEVEWQDRVFLVNATVDSSMVMKWGRLGYRYSMVNNGRTEAGIAASISTYEFDLSLAGDSIINEDVGGQPGNGPPDDPIVEHVRSETEILAPIPTLGIFLRHALTPALQFVANFDLFYLETGDYEGTLGDTTLGLEWYFTRRAGFGLASNITNIDVRNTGEDPYKVDYRQSGLVGYVVFPLGDRPR